MLIKSFSKLNLSLSVNKKLKKNGLHDIQSYFCKIDLFDEIKIKKINGKKDVIKFKGKFARNVKKQNNSVLDVLKILRKKKLISNYYSVIVNKKIPVFSGMGGGTSNAFYLIKYLTKNKFSNNLVKIFDKKIGSDLKLFLYDQGFLQNIKKIYNFSKKYKLYFLLIYPNIKSSTRYVYSKVGKYSKKTKFNFKKINNRDKFINFLIKKNNDLQSIVENKHPTIKRLINEIRQKDGCCLSRMSGSGSVCYGLFKSEKTAKSALNKLKFRYPKYWLLNAKTI